MSNPKVAYIVSTKVHGWCSLSQKNVCLHEKLKCSIYMKNLLKYTHGAKSTILRNNSEQTLCILDTYRKMASSDVAMEDNPARQSVEV